MRQLSVSIRRIEQQRNAGRRAARSLPAGSTSLRSQSDQTDPLPFPDVEDKARSGRREARPNGFKTIPPPRVRTLVSSRMTKRSSLRAATGSSRTSLRRARDAWAQSRRAIQYNHACLSLGSAKKKPYALMVLEGALGRRANFEPGVEACRRVIDALIAERPCRA